MNFADLVPGLVDLIGLSDDLNSSSLSLSVSKRSSRRHNLVQVKRAKISSMEDLLYEEESEQDDDDEFENETS
jgi:hypothetical protein